MAYHRIALLVLGAALAGPVRLVAQAPASPEAAVEGVLTEGEEKKKSAQLLVRAQA